MTQKSNKTEKEKAKKVAKETAENVKKTTKKAEQTVEDKAKKASSKAKSAASEMKDKAGKAAAETKEKVEEVKEDVSEANFWDDVQGNISEGAKVLNEEAKEFAEKVSSYSENIFGVIREKASDALNYGTNLTKEAVNYAQTMAEKYRDRVEVSKLNEEKKKASSQLGMNIYLAYKNNDNRVPVQTFSQKKVKSVLKELEELDKKILDLTEEEEKKK